MLLNYFFNTLSFSIKYELALKNEIIYKTNQAHFCLENNIEFINGILRDLRIKSSK